MEKLNTLNRRTNAKLFAALLELRNIYRTYGRYNVTRVLHKYHLGMIKTDIIRPFIETPEDVTIDDANEIRCGRIGRETALRLERKSIGSIVEGNPAIERQLDLFGHPVEEHTATVKRPLSYTAVSSDNTTLSVEDITAWLKLHSYSFALIPPDNSMPIMWDAYAPTE